MSSAPTQRARLEGCSGTLQHPDAGRIARRVFGENQTRWEAVRAATLGVLNRTTLPRPPDPRAKCYLSGLGAEDIRPQLFRALPCEEDEWEIIEAIGYIQS